MQKKLLTQSLHMIAEDVHQCRHCDIKFTKLPEGRRHIMKHLNLIRFHCSLCLAGAFFFSDIRTHLKDKHCLKLEKFAEVMTDEECDKMTLLVDPSNTGAVVSWQGKVKFVLWKRCTLLLLQQNMYDQMVLYDHVMSYHVIYDHLVIYIIYDHLVIYRCGNGKCHFICLPFVDFDHNFSFIDRF